MARSGTALGCRRNVLLDELSYYDTLAYLQRLQRTYTRLTLCLPSGVPIYVCTGLSPAEILDFDPAQIYVVTCAESLEVN